MNANEDLMHFNFCYETRTNQEEDMTTTELPGYYNHLSFTIPMVVLHKIVELYVSTYFK